ncbi:MAG: sulfotransferase domain-containing protein [Deltaproteobacteria bacterium]|nr:sulfotransferase domain-containing protein [Deltaproteobacteria bacterium]
MGPEFFIVGAPKCGTTSLYSYLSRHPDVFMPTAKDINYFGSDLHLPRRLTHDEYFGLFERARPGQLVGEASVWYLVSELAATEIHGYQPLAKIIVMLRNPVDLMYSLYNQIVYDAGEDILEFEAALAAEESRNRGELMPPGSTFVECLQYARIATFTPQVARYFDTFGRDRVHVIIFDDLKSDPAGVFRDCADFLGRRKIQLPTFPVVNSAKKYRSMRLRRLLVHGPPPWLRVASRVIMPARMRATLARTVNALNTKALRSPPLGPNLRSTLAERARPDIERLSALIGRDLSGWTSLGASKGRGSAG